MRHRHSGRSKPEETEGLDAEGLQAHFTPRHDRGLRVRPLAGGRVPVRSPHGGDAQTLLAEHLSGPQQSLSSMQGPPSPWQQAFSPLPPVLGWQSANWPQQSQLSVQATPVGSQLTAGGAPVQKLAAHWAVLLQHWPLHEHAPCRAVQGRGGGGETRLTPPRGSR
jgi:hypothetical protein